MAIAAEVQCCSLKLSGRSEIMPRIPTVDSVGSRAWVKWVYSIQATTVLQDTDTDCARAFGRVRSQRDLDAASNHTKGDTGRQGARRGRNRDVGLTYRSRGQRLLICNSGRKEQQSTSSVRRSENNLEGENDSALQTRGYRGNGTPMI